VTEYVVVVMTVREATALLRTDDAKLSAVERKLARGGKRKLRREIDSDRRVPSDTRSTELVLDRYFKP
jgi:hypothetical protein